MDVSSLDSFLLRFCFHIKKYYNLACDTNVDMDFCFNAIRYLDSYVVHQFVKAKERTAISYHLWPILFYKVFFYGEHVSQ